MFCPWCGDELVDLERELTCVRGNMGLSPRMKQCLTERFILRSSTPPEHNSLKTSGTWFCPAHGALMKLEAGGIARCPECRLSINDFIYELTEVHPHAKFEVSDDVH